MLGLADLCLLSSQLLLLLILLLLLFLLLLLLYHRLLFFAATYRIQQANCGWGHHMQRRIDLLVLLPHIEHHTLRGWRRHATPFHGWPKIGHGRAGQHALIQYVILLITRVRKREIALVMLAGGVPGGVELHLGNAGKDYDFYSRLHVGRKMIVKLERGRGHFLAVQQKGGGALQFRRVSLMAIEALQEERRGINRR